MSGDVNMKVIITDLDRTLLRTDKTISPYTLDVLRKCREKGLLLFAATARPERSILRYQAQVGFDAVTTLNGARIQTQMHNEEYAISPDCAERIMEKLLRIPGMMISVETDNGLFASVDRPEWGAAYFAGFPKLPVCGAVYKILASSDGELSEREINNVLPKAVYCTTANRNLFQIMSRNATKWNGICTMLCAFGISEDEAVYFGDDHDDLEPIQKCGMGVAVANAIPEVSAKAKWITLSNDEDGVARFIEENIL